MTEGKRQAGAIEITPEMIEAGVQAHVLHYDPEDEGLTNLRETVRAVLRAGIELLD